MGWFVISRFQDCKDLKVHHWSRIGLSSPGLPGFQGLSSPGFQGSLLEQVWICDLEVHQQVAARAVNVATVTLQIKQNYVHFHVQYFFAIFHSATVALQRNSEPHLLRVRHSAG